MPLGGVQQRMLFQSLRDQMLRQLISCDGAKCMADLVDILQKEMESGIPSSRLVYILNCTSWGEDWI